MLTTRFALKSSFGSEKRNFFLLSGSTVSTKGERVKTTLVAFIEMGRGVELPFCQHCRLVLVLANYELAP